MVVLRTCADLECFASHCQKSVIFTIYLCKVFHTSCKTLTNCLHSELYFLPAMTFSSFH